MSTMKQGKLDFSATKRKGTGTATGKPKASVAQPQASTSKESSTRPKTTTVESKPKAVRSIKQEDLSSEDDIEEFDESPVELEEEIERPITPPPPPTTGRTTRSSAKKSTTIVTEEEPSKESSSATTKASVFRPSNAKTEDVIKKVEANSQQIDKLPHLNVNDPKYRRLHLEAREKMGGLPMIHAGKQTKIHEILRVFDNSYEYGPCVGMTRRERWDRAHAIGLNPPKEIDEILKTQEGSTNPEFIYNVFHGQV